MRGMFWVLLAISLFFALDPRPPWVPLDSLGDKWEHMLAFAALTGAAVLGWPRRSPLLIALLLIAVGGLIEVLQMIPALHRDSDWRDFVADCLAILVTALLSGVLRKWFAPAGALP